MSDCSQIHCYSAVSVEEFLVENNMTVIPCLPYSLDLALCDVFHFSKLKVLLKGRRFNGTIMIQALGYTCPLSNSAFHVVVQPGLQLVGSSYKVPRRLHSRDSSDYKISVVMKKQNQPRNSLLTPWICTPLCYNLDS